MSEESGERRWRLIREVVVFSAKVALEAMRDLVLFPFALLAGVLGLLAGGDHPERLFEQTRHLGARFDRWLNLFGEHDDDPDPTGIDQHFARIEGLLRQEVERGGVTAQAKATIDRALDTLQQRGSKPPPPRVKGGK